MSKKAKTKYNAIGLKFNGKKLNKRKIGGR